MNRANLTIISWGHGCRFLAENYKRFTSVKNWSNAFNPSYKSKTYLRENLLWRWAVRFAVCNEMKRGAGAGACTEMRFILCTWFGEFCSCCSLTALPGPAWVLLNWICEELISSLYCRGSRCLLTSNPQNKPPERSYCFLQCNQLNGLAIMASKNRTLIQRSFTMKY